MATPFFGDSGAADDACCGIIVVMQMMIHAVRKVIIPLICQ
jgi:hypothetical protein